MTNETQSRINESSQQKEGAGKESIILFCCAFFLLFQSILWLDLFPDPPKQNAQLTVLPNQKIVLENVSNLTFLETTSLDSSPETHQLAPFFFLPVAINYCNKSLLMSVKGIGPGLAESIIQTRKQIGSFSAPEDLLQISGIGPVRLRNFTPYFSFSKDHE
jgi:helix-hairpin-helix protein